MSSLQFASRSFLLLLALGAAAGGLTACSGDGGSGEPPEPWRTCRAVSNLDATESLPLEPHVPAVLRERVRQAFDLPYDLPAEQLEPWTVWRCMDGQVWACVVGANLPCGEKADTGRTATDAMRDFCLDPPDGETVPAVVTGRATVYTWGCRDGRPEVVGQWSEPDARGFHRDLWRQIDAPPD
jgi:hypothetical protein